MAKKTKNDILQNWEIIAPKRKEISGVLPSVEVTGLSFGSIKTKYSGDSQDSIPNKANMDKQW